MNDRVKIDITTSTLLRIAAIVLGLLFLFAVRTILLQLFFVAILVSAFRPTVLKWEKKFGKPLAITILIISFIIVIGGFIYLVVPPLINQINQLVNDAPGYLHKIQLIRDRVPSISDSLSNLSKNLGNITSSFIGLTTSLFGGLVGFFTVIVLTIYFLADEKIFTAFVDQIVPEDKKDTMVQIVNKLYNKIGDWLRGQLLLCLIIGVLAYIGLLIIGVPYALALGVIAGLLEFIPLVGPIVAGSISALVALSISPIAAIIVIVFFIVLQQLENNIIVPKIMQKAVGLPPAIIIIALMIGSELLGIMGALVAVPLSGVLYVVFQEWKTIRRLIFREEQKHEG